MKLSIVGMGRVGSTLAYSVLLRGLCDEMVLVSRRREAAEGEACDLQHALSFANKPATVRAGDVGETAGSDIVVICASAPTPANIASRLEMGPVNARLFDELIPPVAAESPGAILLIVTNPVDVLTYHALTLSKFDPARVIGTGTLIDSARLRSMMSQSVGIHPDDVRVYIMGEHGDSQFPAFSIARAGGVRFEDDAGNRELFRQAVRAGADVFRRKGYTNYAIASAATLVIDAIVHDARRTMPVSVLVQDYLGVSDVCLSVPVVIGRAGVTRVLRPELSEAEVKAFGESARVVREAMREAGVGPVS